MFTNFKDYLNETINSAALKDQVYLSAKEIVKGGGEEKEQTLNVTAKALSKLYHAREKDIKKMIQDKIKEHSK